MSIAANLTAIKIRIAQAAHRAGRDPQDIKLLVAGKYADASQLVQLIKAGQRLSLKDQGSAKQVLIGENKAQDLKQKYATIGDQAEWHFIGHLQRNKVKDVVPLITMLHSLDSIRLADELEKQLTKINKILPVLIEVNIAGEVTKSGVSIRELDGLVKHCRNLPHLKLEGLMTMNRSEFSNLRQLAQKYHLPELSMGTSADFEMAVEEGATIVRLGRIVFS